MLSRDFELYYYEDSSLAKVDSHTHDYYEFYFFIEGHAGMQIDDSVYPVQFGDVLLIPPHVRHHAVIHDLTVPYRRFVFWISNDFLEELRKLSDCYAYAADYVTAHHCYHFHLEQIAVNSLQSKMFRLLEEMQSSHFGKEQQIALYVRELILTISRLLYELLEPKPYKNDLSLFTMLVEYIEDHIKDELTLEKLASDFYVSKYHIAHIFKDNMGLSIHQYITKKRLLLCQEAIRSSQNISDVYHTYGFGDYSSFYRAFKKEFGISPKEYRDTQVSVAPITKR